MDATTITIILVIAVVAGFYMAWNIGANDVANAMATSVGSGALTHNRAVVLAAILEFSGAVLVGAHVTDTVRKKIVDPASFSPDQLMLGMVAALFAAGTFLLVASWWGKPVSTTHAIVGAVFGFGLLVGGASTIHWGKMGQIVLSWFISPTLAGAMSFVIFTIIQRAIINATDPVSAAKRWSPVFIFFVFAILTLVTIFKGLKNLHLDLSFDQAVQIAALVGLAAAVVGGAIIRGLQAPRSSAEDDELRQPAGVVRGLSDLHRRVQGVRAAARGPLAEQLARLEAELSAVSAEYEKRSLPEKLDPQFRMVEKIFAALQVLSACFVAFAHGSNDVANAIGPLAAVFVLARQGSLVGKAPVPLWALALGGAGIVLGLAMFGRRVMATVGKHITELTPSRGFSAEFAAATTIVVASRLGLPVSTTHTVVGAVLGVGLARGLASLNTRVIKDIFVAWMLQIPVAALLTVTFYGILRWIF